jgi:hypothetical protein
VLYRWSMCAVLASDGWTMTCCISINAPLVEAKVRK